MNQTDLEQELEALHETSFFWALSCCQRNRYEAEEVLQTSYLKVLDGRARFNGKSSVKTWFLAVIRKTASEHSRRNILKKLGFVRLNNLSLSATEYDSSQNPASLLANTETKMRLLQVLQELPRRQRQMLELVFYQDLTIQDAAIVLGISLGSARVHYDRGKRQMREKLEGEQ